MSSNVPYHLLGCVLWLAVLTFWIAAAITAEEFIMKCYG